MQTWYQLSLRSKLIAASLSISLAPLLILAVSVRLIGQPFADAIIQERNQYLAEHIAAHVEELLAEKVSSLRLSAATPAVQSMDAAKQQQQLEALVKTDPDLLAAVTVDREGRQIARSDGLPPDATINYFDRDYFMTAYATKQTAFSDSQPSRLTGILSIAIAQPILDDKLEVRGLIISAVDLQKLIDLIQQYPVGKTGFTFLINSAGAVLYHPLRNIGDDLSHLVHLDYLRLRESGVVRYEDAGQPMVSGFAAIKQTGWFLVVREPWNEAMADFLHIQRILFILFVFTAVLSGLIGNLIAYSMARPLTDLISMAERLAVGDLNVSIWLQDSSVKPLADAFNNMAIQIWKRETDLKEREERYRSVVEQLSLGVYRRVGEGDTAIRYANPALVKIFGCASSEELLSEKWFHFFLKQPDFRAFIDKIHAEGQVYNMEIRLTRPDGQEIWCSATASRRYSADAKQFWIDAAIEDITERKLARERLQQAYASLELKVHERTAELEDLNEKLRSLSLMDGLTGIANRRYFDDFLQREWRRARREQLPLSMLLLDVDHFKLYNDTYGHIAGDECLKQLAMVLKGAAKRATDLAARYGGEEFALILADTPQEQAQTIAQQLLSAVEKLQLEHRTSPVRSYVTVSIGSATFVPDRNLSEETILLAADRALYLAKQNGRNQVQRHVPPDQAS